MTWLPLLVVGLVFIAIILLLRFTTYKTMTERVCSLDPDNDYCRKHYNSSIDRNVDGQKTSEIIKGDTPNGGVKTVIYYLDDKNKKTTRQKATKALLRELNEKNQVVYETWTNMD